MRGGFVFLVLEQTPTSVFQDFFVAILCQLARFLSPHGIDGFVEMFHNVKTIQNDDGVNGFLGNHFRIRFPHITTNRFQPLAATSAKVLKKTQQGFDLAIFTNIQ